MNLTDTFGEFSYAKFSQKGCHMSWNQIKTLESDIAETVAI